MKKLINVISVILVVALLAGLSTMAWKQVSDGADGGSGKKEKEEVTEAVPVFDPVADGWTHYIDYTSPSNGSYSHVDTSQIPSVDYYLVVFWGPDLDRFELVQSDFDVLKFGVISEHNVNIFVLEKFESSFDGLDILGRCIEQKYSEDENGYVLLPNYKYFSIYYSETLPDGYVTE